VEWPLQYADLFASAGVRAPKGILLTGPPGCGKTLLAKAIASESKVNFISVKGPALLSKFVGSRNVRARHLRTAKQAAPCIVFFDEIDALAPARGVGGSDAHVAERVLSQFLTEFDGVEDLKGVLVLGATNRPDMLDPAILRPDASIRSSRSTARPGKPLPHLRSPSAEQAAGSGNQRQRPRRNTDGLQRRGHPRGMYQGCAVRRPAGGDAQNGPRRRPRRRYLSGLTTWKRL